MEKNKVTANVKTIGKPLLKTNANLNMADIIKDAENTRDIRSINMSKIYKIMSNEYYKYNADYSKKISDAVNALLIENIKKMKLLNL